MSKVPPTIVDAEKPESIVKSVTEVTRVVDSNIEFGSPQNPYDDQDDIKAGSPAVAGGPTIHNGSIQNIKGSWVEVVLGPSGDEGLDEPYTCNHNLGVPVAVAGEPNVRWILFGIEHDGEQATWWDDIRVRPNSMRQGTGGPDWSTPWITDGKGSEGVGLYWFDDDEEDEFVYFNVEMPHNWTQGTTIYPHVHWVTTAGGNPQAGEVVLWEFEYTWANIGSVFPATTVMSGLTHYPDDDPLEVNTHYVTPFDSPTNGIDGSGQTISSVLVCRLGRRECPANGHTNLDEDAGLLMVSFHYLVDGFGSQYNSDLYLKDATTAAEAGTATCRFQEGDTVTENSIELRFHANQILDVSNSHRLKATLFFIPAVRGISNDANP